MKSTEAVIVYRIGLLVMVVMVHCMVGCGDRVRLPSPDRVAEFEAAGPQGPVVDMGRIVQARMPSGLYRVASDDVLQLEMPAALYPDLSESGAAGADRTHTCRVSDAGVVTLPDGHQISVVGKSLGEVEAAVVETYYPALVKTRPAVFVQVLEYRTARFHITGAVQRPGVYNLRRDQMSLVSLLMEAGGIVDQGSAMIRITRSPQGSGLAAKASESRRPHAAGGRWDVPRDVSIRFEPEGPLRTTGWLVLEEGRDVRIRQWFDIANTFQRWAVLRKLADESDHLPAAALNEKLSQLAARLESDERRAVVKLAAQGTQFGWQSTETGHFWASLSEKPADESAGGERIGARAVARGAPTTDDVTLALPVRGLNVPFADVPLREGDSVVVERLQTQYISVVGLVRNPGNFPYPPEAQYNLIQALAFAGGLDPAAEPRFVSVYRLKGDGSIASMMVQLADPDNQEKLTQGLALRLKPGDVVSVEHTPRTRKNVFLDRYFRLNMGMYLRPDELWGGD